MNNQDSYEPRFQGYVEGLKAELQAGTDRGVVLTCASMLEVALEDLLSAFLIDHSITKDLLRHPGKPLNGLANRINMAFAMGLIIPSDRLTLDIVRDVGCEAASSARFELARSEHATRIRDADGRSEVKHTDHSDRDKLFHITMACLSGIRHAIASIGGNRVMIRKTYVHEG